MIPNLDLQKIHKLHTVSYISFSQCVVSLVRRLAILCTAFPATALDLGQSLFLESISMIYARHQYVYCLYQSTNNIGYKNILNKCNVVNAFHSICLMWFITAATTSNLYCYRMEKRFTVPIKRTICELG